MDLQDKRAVVFGWVCPLLLCSKGSLLFFLLFLDPWSLPTFCNGRVEEAFIHLSLTDVDV